MVIQRGSQLRLVLFKTKSRGWGVRTLEHIKKGTFVGINSGELVTIESSQQREDDTYLFNLSNVVMKEPKEVEAPVAVEQSTDEQQQEQLDESSLHCQELGLDQDQESSEEQLEYVEEIPPEQQQQQQPRQPQQPQQQQRSNFFICDAKFFGNFTRFINHSCEPNVIGLRSFTSHQDT